MSESPYSNIESKESPISYSFEIIDPRPIQQAKEANDRIFENPHGVLGIEVTIPAYAERCTLGNIDPQHSEGNADLAAIEVAKTIDVPPNEASLVTVRADLDALGSMALIKYRASGGEVTPEIESRVEVIATKDKFSRGGWPGKTDLPTMENPWPSSDNADVDRSLAAVNARVMDFKVPMAERVQSMHEYLTEGTEPSGYREKIEKERGEMISALERGDIKIELVADGRVAYVETTHMAGTSLGYTQAPIVVAFNPHFKQGQGAEYEKYTVCQYDGSWIDLNGAKSELASLEVDAGGDSASNWGGSPTIIGSPQGRSSKLSKDQIMKVVEKYLKAE